MSNKACDKLQTRGANSEKTADSYQHVGQVPVQHSSRRFDVPRDRNDNGLWQMAATATISAGPQYFVLEAEIDAMETNDCSGNMA